MYMNAYQLYADEINKANDWALGNIATGAHSELKKPYLPENGSYLGMEHYSAQDYMYDTEMHRNDAKLFRDKNKILQQQLHDQKDAFDIRQKSRL